jgi:hypothetical protein
LFFAFVLCLLGAALKIAKGCALEIPRRESRDRGGAVALIPPVAKTDDFGVEPNNAIDLLPKRSYLMASYLRLRTEIEKKRAHYTRPTYTS